MTSAPSRPSPPAEVSVILPFNNAAPYLGDQCAALATQEFAGAWEVVAVDNRSRDESRRIVESFLDRISMRIVGAGQKLGAGYARNVGAKHASGRKLLFVDADDQVAPGFVAAMAAGLDRYDFVTSAFDHRALNPDWVQSAYGPVWRDPADPLFVQFGVLPFAGGSIGISRSVFEAVGGFPEEFLRMEDIALSWEVQLAGTALHYVPNAVYRVRYRRTLRGLFRQGLTGSSYAPLLYRRYRSAGMARRTFTDAGKSWIRLALNLSKARTKGDLAPLALQLGRELGRLRGSLRHHALFP